MRLPEEPGVALGPGVRLVEIVGDRDPADVVCHRGPARGVRLEYLCDQRALDVPLHYPLPSPPTPRALAHTKDVAKRRSRKSSWALKARWSASLGK